MERPSLREGKQTNVVSGCPRSLFRKSFPAAVQGAGPSMGPGSLLKQLGFTGRALREESCTRPPQGVFPRHRPPEHVCARHTRSPGKASNLDQVPEAKQGNDFTCLQGPAPKVVCDLNPTAASRPVTKGLAALRQQLVTWRP